MKTKLMLQTTIVAMLVVFLPPSLGHQVQAQRSPGTPPKYHKVTAKQLRLRPGFSVTRRTQGTFVVARTRTASIVFSGSCNCEGLGECKVIVSGNVIVCAPGSPPCNGQCALTVEFPDFRLRSRGIIY